MKRKALLLVTFVASIGFALVLGELILRAVGFSYELYPREIQFGWPDPVTIEKIYVPDSDLYWVTKDYDEKIETMRTEAPSILYMGDSCTELGRYDRYLHELFTERHPGGRLRYGNVGVAGWSSYQGLKQLERDILSLEPRIITMHFGWNDHWESLGIEDKDLRKITDSFLYRLNRLRLVQLLSKLRVTLGKDSGEGAPPLRVSLEDFRRNITEMVRLARGSGAVPVLLTAPSAHERGKEPRYLRDRWLSDLDQLVPLHQRYVSALRDVARLEDVALIDLAAYFDRLPGDAVRERYFLSDGIHLTEEGNRIIAELLYGYFERHGLLIHLLELSRLELGTSGGTTRARSELP